MPVGRNERGDTLVEVLMAFTILSMVAVAAFGVMNRGVGEALNSLERSQVRTYATQQVEIATYLRDQYVAALANGSGSISYPSNLWSQIKTRAIANKTQSPTLINECASVMQNSFYLVQDPATNLIQVRNFTSAELATSTMARPGAGMWIEPVASISTGNVAFQQYVDLYVKSCWDPAAGSTKQTLSSVVRLYDR